MDRLQSGIISKEYGFLPDQEPLERLPRAFDAWENIAAALPKLLVSDYLREMLAELPPFSVELLASDREIERAMVLLSYLGHAYVWGEEEPAEHLPAVLAVPWHKVAVLLGRPPVLSYASYALHNWRRVRGSGPVAVGNIDLVQNFLGGLDEEWFILIHVDIEAKAAPALAALPRAQEAVVRHDSESLGSSLASIHSSLLAVCATLDRMVEHCDPYIYFNRVRPYIHGWQDHPALPRGLVYDGVEEYGGIPQKFRGETGAQSGIIPALDGALGIEHADDPLRVYLMQLRQYMPPRHRTFVESIEKGPSVRRFILRHNHHLLREAYNECVLLVQRFRTTHLEFAGRYVHKQSLKNTANPTEIGTGGTPFMVYLKKHKEETAKYLI
jgi:indoleamine 2,3-dioxygenase